MILSSDRALLDLADDGRCLSGGDRGCCRDMGWGNVSRSVVVAVLGGVDGIVAFLGDENLERI